MREDGKKRGRLVSQLLSRPRKLMVTIYIGNEFVNVALVAVVTSLMIKILGSSPYIATTLISLLLLMIFGEITPKTYGISNSEKFAFSAAPYLHWFVIVLGPLQYLITKVANSFVSLFGVRDISREPSTSDQEIITLIDMGEEGGVLPAAEKEMIQGVFGMGDISVSEVMIPRTDIFSLSVDEPIELVIDKISNNFYSRIPIYKDEIDNIVGILYTREILGYIENGSPGHIKDMLHPPLMIPESKKVNDALSDLLSRKVHLAVVLDEHGGVAGIVTLEDLLEELFGEIEGEYRKDEKDIVDLGGGSYTVSAKTDIEEFNEQFNLTIPNEDFDTVGGFVFDSIGRVPKIGESIKIGSYLLTVRKMKKHRLDSILLKRNPSAAENIAGEEGKES